MCLPTRSRPITLRTPHSTRTLPMLGDKLGGETGKVILRKVLPSAPGVARTETTQRGAGTLLEIEYQVVVARCQQQPGRPCRSG